MDFTELAKYFHKEEIKRLRATLKDADPQLLSNIEQESETYNIHPQITQNYQIYVQLQQAKQLLYQYADTFKRIKLFFKDNSFEVSLAKHLNQESNLEKQHEFIGSYLRPVIQLITNGKPYGFDDYLISSIHTIWNKRGTFEEKAQQFLEQNQDLRKTIDDLNTYRTLLPQALQVSFCTVVAQHLKNKDPKSLLKIHQSDTSEEWFDFNVAKEQLDQQLAEKKIDPSTVYKEWAQSIEQKIKNEKFTDLQGSVLAFISVAQEKVNLALEQFKDTSDRSLNDKITQHNNRFKPRYGPLYTQGFLTNIF
jgi:hypothetical protein